MNLEVQITNVATLLDILSAYLTALTQTSTSHDHGQLLPSSLFTTNVMAVNK